MRPPGEIERMHAALYAASLAHPQSSTLVLAVLDWVRNPLVSDLELLTLAEAITDDAAFSSPYPVRDTLADLTELVGIDPREESSALIEHLGSLGDAELTELASVAGRLQRIVKRTQRQRLQAGA